MRRERSMDSGNTSGSMSSSGGDEEYDSRQDSLQSFLNPSAHFETSLSSNPQSSLFHHLQHQPQQPTLFDPAPNLFHPFSPQNSNVNPSLPTQLGLVPSGRIRSDPNYTIGLGNTSSSQSAMNAVHQTPLPSMQLRTSSLQNDGSAKPSSSSQSDHQAHVVTRNPKKRTRASRRAPTTVLTTDTTNFRAMVQEFTGIPSPPFTGTSMYPRRLDFFGSGSPIGSLFPIRPSAQKVHQQTPFIPSNIATTSISNNNSSSLSITLPCSTFSNPSSINYQQQQTQTLLNMQHQLLPFHPLLQPSLSVPDSTKSQSGLALPSLDELGMSHSHVNVSLGALNDVSLMRPAFDGNFLNLQRLNSSGNSGNTGTCKLNYTGGGSSEFQLNDHRPAGLDNVPSRGESSSVDPWICPEINEAK